LAPDAPGAGWRLLVGIERHVVVGRRRSLTRTVAGMSHRDAALYYGELGLPVFPCEIRGKAPLTRHGCKDASSHREHIWRWWGRWPRANIGVATGPASGWLVVDLDGPEGEASWGRLTDQHGQAATLEQTTGRGRHLIFSNPAELELHNTAGRLGRGIDTRATNGYILVAPSVHPSGRLYRWLWPEGYPDIRPSGNGVPGPLTRQRWHIPRTPITAPAWLLARLAAERPRPAGRRSRRAPGAIPHDLPRHLARQAGERPNGDRSRQTWRLVVAAVEWGLDDDQALGLAISHRPTVEKYGDRAEREVDRILARVRPDHQHVGLPCDRADCHNRPDWMR
jgi:hypothetical protein